MTKVCVASRSFSRHPILRAELLEKYADVTFNDAGLSLSGSILIDFVDGHDRAITALEKLDAAFFSALPDLKVISKYGVGYDMCLPLAGKCRKARGGNTGDAIYRNALSALLVAGILARI